MKEKSASVFKCRHSGASCLLLIGVFICALGTLSACKDKGEAKSVVVPEVTVVKPSIKPVTDYLDFTGNAVASDTVQLQARVPGFLTKVNFKDGAWVKGGDVLFEIEPETYEAQVKLAEAALAAAQAELARANSEYNRQLDLVKQRAVAVADVEKWKAQRDAMQAAVYKAQAELDIAQIQYSYTRVKAPFDGRVDRSLKDPGNLVGASESTLLTTIYRMDPVYGYFSINEKDLVRVRTPGKADAKRPVSAAIEGESGYPHQGFIDFGSSSLDTNTGTMQLRGVFDNPHYADMPKILPGMFLRLRVPVGERAQAVWVPNRAIGIDQGGRYVLTVDAKDTVEKKAVTAGALVDGMQVIEEGLKGDESIVVNGLQQARPGTKVKAVLEAGKN